MGFTQSFLVLYHSNQIHPDMLHKYRSEFQGRLDEHKKANGLFLITAQLPPDKSMVDNNHCQIINNPSVILAKDNTISVTVHSPDNGHSGYLSLRKEIYCF